MDASDMVRSIEYSGRKQVVDEESRTGCKVVKKMQVLMCQCVEDDNSRLHFARECVSW